MIKPLKKPYFYLFLSSLATLLFSGCSKILTNVTPQTAQRNTSNRYRFMLHSKMLDTKCTKFEPALVIDGNTYPLQQASFDKHFFYCDYCLDSQRREALYYFVLTYEKQHRNHGLLKTLKTQLAKLIILEHCVFSLETDRAPIGTEVHILGRGFSSNNRVIVGDCNVRTQFVSENVLSFVTPTVIANKTYPVWLIENNEKQFIGNLLIDNAVITVSTKSIELESSQSVELTFSIGQPAGGTGLAIDVTTDIPDSVIMPEVLIPAHETQVTIQIEGGDAGQGSLFINAPGYDELTLPIQVFAAGEGSSSPATIEE